ncbi:acyltransferase [Mucilaginibacter sp. Bleaf8]|uniref:acyltransferase family protein n=1 Tax=Mucilaginibacter sp. Bleaf8 TaxID=2834430 RepID=UPI001BD09776|nr:acyltransferase [Mucilaginibacter sp. Bleaf8]MBS7563979.1 acyltransferase [Mucilaginibacter sp. Bleaf8]
MPLPAPTSEISGRHKLLGLDHLRAMAITYVVLFHYQMFGHPDWINRVGEFGWTGVDLFFVLSGFLIAGQLFDNIVKKNTLSMRVFFIKRFFRITPPYLVIVMLYFAFPSLREREQMASLWRYLTFTLNLDLDLRHIGTFTHAWSLCIEEQFYLILPILILLLNKLNIGKKATYILLSLFLSGFLIRYLNWHYFMEPNLQSDSFDILFYKVIYYPTYNRLDGLLIGVSIAGLYTFYPSIKESINKFSNILMLTGVVVLIGSYFVCTPQQSFSTAIAGYPLVAISYGLITAAVVCPDNILYNAKSWLTSQMATLSYGIYLIHKLAFHLTQNLLVRTGIDKNGNLMLLSCLCSTICFALILRYTIERPSIRLRNRFL